MPPFTTCFSNQAAHVVDMMHENRFIFVPERLRPLCLLFVILIITIVILLFRLQDIQSAPHIFRKRGRNQAYTNLSSHRFTQDELNWICIMIFDGHISSNSLCKRYTIGVKQISRISDVKISNIQEQYKNLNPNDEDYIRNFNMLVWRELNSDNNSFESD